MNERIDELVKKFAEDFVARSGCDVREFDPFLVESRLFAELIVRECAEQVSRTTEADSILEHFGIEEGREEEVFSCPACGLQNPTTTCGLPNCGLIY